MGSNVKKADGNALASTSEFAVVVADDIRFGFVGVVSNPSTADYIYESAAAQSPAWPPHTRQSTTSSSSSRTWSTRQCLPRSTRPPPPASPPTLSSRAVTLPTTTWSRTERTSSPPRAWTSTSLPLTSWPSASLLPPTLPWPLPTLSTR